MATKKKPAKTAASRATEQNLANHPTKHVCMSEKCPTPKQQILQKDLLTAVEAPKRRKLYFHRSCWVSR